MAKFSGKEQHAIDSKGRLMIPIKFRRILSATSLYMVKMPEGHLDLYEPDDWKTREQKLEALSDDDPQQRAMKTLVYASLDRLTLDRQGRIVIPKPFLEHAGISKEIIVLGAGNKIMLWQPERLKELLVQQKEEHKRLSQLIL